MKKAAYILMAGLIVGTLVRGQNVDPEVLAPGENLVTEGIPKIPASLLKKLSPYIGAFAFRLAGWDATPGELLLKNLAGSETRILRAKAGESPKLALVIPTGVYDVYYQPQQKYFVYDKDANGDDQFQLYLFDLATRKSTLLTDGKSRNTEPAWSNSGDRIIFSSSPPNGNGVDLSLINPFDPKETRLLASGNGNYLKVHDWSPDDRKAVFTRSTSNTSRSLWIVDIATGEKTRLSPEDDRGEDYYDSPQFSKDGAGVYTITDHGSEFRRLAYISIRTKRLTYLSKEINADVEDFKLSPDGKAIALVVNENGVSRLRMLDTKTDKDGPAPQLPEGIISDLEWRANSVDFAFNFKSRLSVNDVYSFNVESGKLEQRYQGVTGFDAGKLPSPQQISWKSFDGRAVSGFLYRPPASFTGRRPVIVDIHGGPEDQYRPEFGYYHNYFLNELGIAVIFPNVRGSTGYGKSFQRLDNGILRANACKDIGALLDWVKIQPDLDADQVIVRGGSYGGYLALSVAASYADRIRAAISDSGPSNLVTFLENTAGWRRDLQRREFGDERDPKMRAFLERISPLNNADKIKKPLFIIQGQNDPRVPIGEAQQMLAALKKNKTPVWYLLAKNEGHDWSKLSNLNFRLCATVLFIEEHLMKRSP